jgi:RHS repeat-associated protein
MSWYPSRSALAKTVALSWMTFLGGAPGLAHAHVAHRMTCSTSFTAITPCTSSSTVFINSTGNTKVFQVQNKIPTEPGSYFVSCTHTGAVASCSVPSSMTVPANSTRSLTLTYGAGATTGTGTVTVTLDDGLSPLVATLSVTVTTPPPPPTPTLHLLSVFPHYQTWDADPSESSSAQFHIANKGFVLDTFTFTATCIGTGISGSCTPASGSKIVAAGADSVVSIALTSGATNGLVGTLSVVAARASDATVRDSGSVAVTVKGAAAGTDITTMNSGASVERDFCLSIAVGAGAAYECGDLRLAHALPTVRTLNAARTPVLLYSSRQAHPFAVVGADVTTGATVPDSVFAILRGPAGDSLAGGRWGGSAWTANSTRRIALSFDALAKGYATGLYSYSFVARRKYGGTISTDSLTGEFPVVNRSTSAFGPGWWLAGFERLYKVGTDLLWVGGDGSTRRYVRQASGTSWAAAGVDRPDTIKIVTSPAGYYERYLPHKLEVRFDTTTLAHVQTVNRLGQVTKFYSDPATQRLDSILVPAGVRRAYVFHYDAGSHLRSIDAPALPSTRRFDSLVVNGSSQITAIRDPDASAVSFLLDGSMSNRIVARIDQKQDTLSFTYGAGGMLTGSSISLDATHVIAESFQPSETRGIAGTPATTPAQTSTLFDGPRTDVGDTMRVWTDRFGAPRKIRNAYGDETVLTRANATYPALVTRMQAPNGRIVSASYDARGNILTSIDSSTYDPTRSLYAKTTYTWDPAWDFVTKTVRPEGDNDSTSYDPVSGNRLWQQDGRGASSRVSFFYYTSGITAGLVRATQAATLERDTVAYDGTLGNLAFTQTPLGFRETVRTDSLGRVVRDSTPTNAAADTAVIATHNFDLLDRDTLTITTGGTTASQTALRVRTGYDAIGNPLWVRRIAVPDPNAIDTVIRTYTYDRANRKLTEFPGGLYTFTWSYDPAGNVLVDGRTNVVTTYDALGRPAVRVGIDTARYVYDEMGQVLHAINRPARIHRRYAPNGTLVIDTTQLATNNLIDQNYSTYVSAFTPRYDLNLRRTALVMGTDSIRYHYAPQWGALDTLTDPFGHKFAWTYDADGRVTQLARHAERTDTTNVELTRYDADSRLRYRSIVRGSSTVLADSLTYDRRGKVVRNVLNGDSLAYTALGHLRYGRYANATGVEAYTYDAAGNKVASIGVPVKNFAYDQHQDLLRTVLQFNGGLFWDTVSYGYTSKGDQSSEIHTHPYTRFSGQVMDTAKENRITSSSYTAGLMTSSQYTLDTIFPNSPHYQIYQRKESYRYDALGRRVWVELVRDTNCTTHDVDSDCSNYVRRVTWDGSQILHETQVAADTGKFDAILEGGSVTYVHGGTIDQPLEVYTASTNLILPYTNWHGQFVRGTCVGGGCSGVQYPLADASAYDDIQGGVAQGTWFGTLIKGQLDASGYEYKRNRYYNPSTGRFNQEDPIGLAGGLNVYGYASGDPANYSDPFGLCSKADGWTNCDTSRPDHDPAFAAKLEGARQRGLANTWLTLAFISASRALVTAGFELLKGALSVEASAEAASSAGSTVGWGGRVLSSGEQAEFKAFGERAQAVGLEENPNRTGNWGKIGENGKFKEVARIDVGRNGASGEEGQTHIHVNGGADHLPVSTPIPGEQ